MNAVLLLALVPLALGAADPPPILSGTRTGDGVQIDARSLTEGTRTKGVVSKPGVDGKTTSVVVTFQYSYVVSCYGNTVGNGDNYCESAFLACAAQGAGPLTTIWRRETTAGTAPGPWVQVGSTCFPDSLPAGGAAPQPVLTYGMVRDEWARTAFAKAGVAMQPPGGRTLVTLPVYVEIAWPGAGYAPGEIRTVTMLGHQVQIKPTLVSYRYGWGDGSAPMVTRSAGGTYPTGDVQHRYDKAGLVTLRADTVYGGQFRVDGGDWVTIDGSVTVAGTAQTLSVLTARNRLTTG